MAFRSVSLLVKYSHLMLGVDVDVETGSNDLDGCNEDLLDGLLLSVGPSLGFSFGKNDTVGCALALNLNDGRIDTTGPLVGVCVVMLTDGSVLPSMGFSLGVSIADCESDGSELTVGR
eukprot:scaffold127299_cov31-Attheya_sp.AAC.1